VAGERSRAQAVQLLVVLQQQARASVPGRHALLGVDGIAALGQALSDPALSAVNCVAPERVAALAKEPGTGDAIPVAPPARSRASTASWVGQACRLAAEAGSTGLF